MSSPCPAPADADALSASQPPTHARFVLTVWLAGAAFIAYLCRTWLGVAEKTIRADLGLSEQQMGLILAGFFWSYALGQIPGGRLGESFGPAGACPHLQHYGPLPQASPAWPAKPLAFCC